MYARTAILYFCVRIRRRATSSAVLIAGKGCYPYEYGLDYRFGMERFKEKRILEIDQPFLLALLFFFMILFRTSFSLCAGEESAPDPEMDPFDIEIPSFPKKSPSTYSYGNDEAQLIQWAQTCRAEMNNPPIPSPKSVSSAGGSSYMNRSSYVSYAYPQRVRPRFMFQV